MKLGNPDLGVGCVGIKGSFPWSGRTPQSFCTASSPAMVFASLAGAVGGRRPELGLSSSGGKGRAAQCSSSELCSFFLFFFFLFFLFLLKGRYF